MAAASYGLADLQLALLRKSQMQRPQPPVIIQNTIDLSPIVDELRRLGGTVIDSAPPRQVPG